VLEMKLIKTIIEMNKVKIEIGHIIQKSKLAHTRGCAGLEGVDVVMWAVH